MAIANTVNQNTNCTRVGTHNRTFVVGRGRGVAGTVIIIMDIMNFKDKTGYVEDNADSSVMMALRRVPANATDGHHQMTVQALIKGMQEQQ